MAPQDFDVAIVGYGPVGAGAAILLARAGLRVVVLEREAEILDLPRAVGLDGEVVRAFQRVGLAEAVAGILQPCRNPDRVEFTDSARRTLFGLDGVEPGLNGWRDLAFFDQPELEQLLRKLADQDDRIDVRLQHEVTAIEQDAEGVRIRAQDRLRDAASELRARYAIGCDGSTSFVRRALGIGWESLGYDQDWLVVDIIQKAEAELPLATMQVCDPARITTYVCTKDPYRRWEFKLLPGESREAMQSHERVRELLRAWLPPEHYELRRSAVYQFHAATASRWQEGRIFLAGDAAHQTPPFLGQGLNAGFRDAVNLAWKLPLVIRGVCGDALLESYEAERDPHARDLVEWAVAVGRLMESLAAAEAGERPEGPSDSERRSGYGQGRSAPPLRAGVIREEQVKQGASTGYLMRQPWLRASGGAEQLLDERLGAGFALVGRDAGALACSASSEAWLEKIGARRLCLDGLELSRGHFDRLFESHAAAVVRPDRYVFGVTDADTSLDELVASLARKLAYAGPLPTGESR